MFATITDIKRFAVHDGDGIRTTVFFKGCPLKCVWCHNPESLSARPVMGYYRHKCLSCGVCTEVCPNGAHQLTADGHAFDRSLCAFCGKCVEECPGEALSLYGKRVTEEELLPLLLEDRAFYKNSGGGVTLSGGECLLQADFCASLLGMLKSEGISTAVDTCGFVPRGNLEKVLPYTDVFLYDMKALDPAVHEWCTGQDNALILENLRYLDFRGAKIEVRIPYVPGMNDGETENIAIFLATLKNLTKVRVLPYHNFAASKYQALDMENT
ncbi:MAG: glycyl-radical enzyme activating protein, partial [Clostridia bacterium]|nr:glycyl-radical enzyme activating protein [Clostridia bacterium]